jgi:signal transduction histidine kinase
LSSLTGRVALVIALVASVPTLVALVPAITPSGAWTATSILLVVGWALIAVGVIGVMSWVVAQALLRPLADLTSSLNPAATATGSRSGASPERAPVEVRLLRAAVIGREAAKRRDTGERSTYVSTLIHDMKTPLLAVERSLAVVEGEADADARRRWVGAARSEVRRLLDLVQDVVDAERLASGTLELQVGEVDLADVCRRVVERLAPVRDDVDIELAPLGSWRHAGDGALLERAIENIVANAVRHARSKVHVDLTPGLVRVADDGPGLPSDFDALGIVKSTLGGTPMTTGVSPRNPGLGLFIAKRILEAHGGRLTLESSGPQGTTMLLYVGVPRREAATAS